MPVRYWSSIIAAVTLRLVLSTASVRPDRRGRGVRPQRLVSPHLLERLAPHARLGTGVLLSGLLLAGAGAVTHSSLLIAPFAATAALKHAAPHSPLARPRNIIGGYVAGAVVGLALGLCVGGGPVAMAVAAAVAAVAMLALDVEHPPAVAMAVVALGAPTPWAVQVAAAGAVVMTLSMVVLAPLLHRSAYPARA